MKRNNGKPSHDTIIPWLGPATTLVVTMTFSVGRASHGADLYDHRDMKRVFILSAGLSVVTLASSTAAFGQSLPIAVSKTATTAETTETRTSTASSPTSLDPDSPMKDWTEAEKALAAQLESINRRRLNIMIGGMGTLTAWAIANIGVGVVGNITSDDERMRAFHQGNWAWNTVNLVIGGIGLYNALNADPATIGYKKTLDAAESAKTVFVINSVLDCVYMATGAWLWERGLRTDEPVMTGWGQALVLQGGFLLAYDLVMWGLTLSVLSDIGDLPIKLVPMGEGAAIVGRF